MRHLLLSLAALCLLTACDSTGALRELRNVSPTGDAYQKALAVGYQNVAERKEANYEWWISKYLADKGLMAAYGRDTQPEDPTNWDIPETTRSEFVEARASLLKAIEGNRTTQPQTAANAVVAYDQWVELASYQWDTTTIEAKREAFFAALADLTTAHTAEAAAQPTESSENVATETQAAPAKPVETTSTILYFPFDSDQLGSSAKAALGKLVSDLQAAGNVTININGHADRAGTEEYNLELSERRAQMVLKALESAGIPAGWMKYFAFGDTDPAVPTAAGVREEKNRRVEIFIE